MAAAYSLEGGNGKQHYAPTFIERVKAFVYNAFFYLPPSTSPQSSEGFVRFDGGQITHKEQLVHMAAMLTEDSLWLVQTRLWCFLDAELDRVNDVASDYGEEAIRALREAGLL